MEDECSQSSSRHREQWRFVRCQFFTFFPRAAAVLPWPNQRRLCGPGSNAIFNLAESIRTADLCLGIPPLEIPRPSTDSKVSVKM